MYVVILGPPYSGKGTISHFLAQHYNFYHFSLGDLFREEIKKATTIGKKIITYINKGLYVPDELTISFVKTKLISLKEQDIKDIIFDGYPRTLEQVKAFEQFLHTHHTPLDHVIYLKINDDILIKRAINRRICPKCGRVYNLLTMKPKNDEICDVCKIKLIIRDDDKDENIIRERLRKYRELTLPVLNYYKSNYHVDEIDASQPFNSLMHNVTSILGLEPKQK